MSDLDRISFGTDGWRDRREEFTKERVIAVGDAFVSYLIEEGHTDAPIAVGYDARAGADEIAEQLAECATNAGFDVWLADRDCPTPALASTVSEFELAGGFMVTASHNPPTYHGIKVIPHGGAPAMPAVTDRLEETIADGPPEPVGATGEIEPFDYVDFHIETILERLELDLDGLSVAYDAMHGSGRGVTDVILENAGASVTRLRCTQEEAFGGTPPEPDAENLEELIDTVDGDEVDLGIANDGDADRVAIVTPEGYLDFNVAFAIIYDYLLEDDSGPVVRSVSTTFLLDRIAEDNGEDVIETPVGFKWIAEKIGQVDALLGGEDSNGLTIRGHVREKDGALVGALAAAIHHEQPLTDRAADLFDRYGEIFHVTKNVDCPESRKQPVLAVIAEDPPNSFDEIAVERTSDVDGRKFFLEDGSWVLVRPSGTEEKLRVYAESKSERRADSIATEAATHLESLV